MKRRQFIQSAATAAAFAGLGLPARDSFAAGSIPVGVLFSQSGTMAPSEGPLAKMALMAIDEINQTGGVRGRSLVPVVADPGSDWPTYASQARKMLHNDKVAAVFGCWTSVSRKEVLPVFKELNGLLFYPVQYEGEELERNVFYTGLAPNQQSIPALNILMSEPYGGHRRFFLLGSDYVYPRTANRIMRNYLMRARNIPAADIAEEYTPLDHEDYSGVVARIADFAARGGKPLVVSTLNGDTNQDFYKALAAAGITADKVPVLAFSVNETEVAALDPRPVGHLAAWSYFMSADNQTNRDFIARYRQWSGDANALVSDPMVATWLAVQVWKQAVEAAATTRVDAVIDRLGGQKVMSPNGSMVMMDLSNHHMQRPLRVGRLRADGQFETIWMSPGPLRAEPFNPYFKDASAPVQSGKA